MVSARSERHDAIEKSWDSYELCRSSSKGEKFRGKRDLEGTLLTIIDGYFECGGKLSVFSSSSVNK